MENDTRSSNFCQYRNGYLLELEATVGPHAYPGHLPHWSGDTFLVMFDNPDAAPGLLTFEFAGSAAAAIGIEGSKVLGEPITTNYDHFARLP